MNSRAWRNVLVPSSAQIFLAVRHDILGFLVAKLKDVMNHLRLACKEHTLLVTLVYHGDNLFLRHIIRIA